LHANAPQPFSHPRPEVKDKGVGRKISRGGGRTREKQDEKLAPIIFSTLSVSCMKIQREYDSPAADAHG